MRPSAFDPPSIPPAFWERPEVCQALRKRDMGALFTAAPASTLGLSQTRIGTAVGLGQGRISEVVNGIRDIRDATVFERIADGLDMPDHARILLGLSPRARSPPAAPAQHHAGHGPARTPTCSGRSPRPAASTPPSSASCKARPTTSGSWTAASAPPPSQASWKPTSATSRPACATPCAPGTASSSPAVLADASALAGWQAIDMSRLPRAWAHFERATAAAREAGDPCLLAFAAGEQAYVLLDLHRPAEALAMVRAAYEETHTAIPHQVRGWLRAAEAEMAAAAGQESTCRTRPRRRRPGRSATARPARICRISPSTRPTWPAGAATAWSCSATHRSPTTSPPPSPPWTAAFTRAEASLRCDLAAALHVRGEQDEAKRHLKRARELAQVTGSARQRRRIRELARRIAKAA